MKLFLKLCLFAIVFCCNFSVYMCFFTVLDELLASAEGWPQLSQEVRMSLSFILLALIVISAQHTNKIVDSFRSAGE